MNTKKRAVGNRVEGKKEKTRQKIISISMNLFREQGFDSTSMEQIAREGRGEHARRLLGVGLGWQMPRVPPAGDDLGQRLEQEGDLRSEHLTQLAAERGLRPDLDDGHAEIAGRVVDHRPLDVLEQQADDVGGVGRLGAGQLAGFDRQQLGELGLRDGLEDGHLAAEVGIDRPRRQPRLGDDLRHRRALETVPRDAADRRIDDLLAALGAALRGETRHTGSVCRTDATSKTNVLFDSRLGQEHAGAQRE